jgi:hypothetical protein
MPEMAMMLPRFASADGEEVRVDFAREAYGLKRPTRNLTR